MFENLENILGKLQSVQTKFEKTENFVNVETCDDVDKLLDMRDDFDEMKNAIKSLEEDELCSGMLSTVMEMMGIDVNTFVDNAIDSIDERLEELVQEETEDDDLLYDYDDCREDDCACVERKVVDKSFIDADAPNYEDCDYDDEDCKCEGCLCYGPFTADELYDNILTHYQKENNPLGIRRSLEICELINEFMGDNFECYSQHDVNIMFDFAKFIINK